MVFDLLFLLRDRENDLQGALFGVTEVRNTRLRSSLLKNLYLSHDFVLF